jgi:hypothetical protein
LVAFFWGGSGPRISFTVDYLQLTLACCERDRQTDRPSTTKRHDTTRHETESPESGADTTERRNLIQPARSNSARPPISRCRSRLNRLLQTAIPIPLKLVRPLFLSPIHFFPTNTRKSPSPCFHESLYTHDLHHDRLANLTHLANIFDAARPRPHHRYLRRQSARDAADRRRSQQQQ